MSKAKIILPLVVTVFGIALAANSINDLANDEPSPKQLMLMQDIDDASLRVLELCMETSDQIVIETCKREINDMKERCNDKSYSSMSICDDSRLDGFFMNLDERIQLNLQKKEIASEKISIATIDVINACMKPLSSTDLILCKESMLMIKEKCLTGDFAQMQVCADPRIEDILSKNAELTTQNLPSLYYVSQSEGEVIVDYKQLLRACVRYAEVKNDFVAEYGMEQFMQIDDIGVSYLREDLGFCLGMIKEIKSLCEPFELCTGIEKFEQTYGQ